MQIALIGFHKSGKTTVFNALTGAGAEVSAFTTGKTETHRAVVVVPDERLDKLHALAGSKRLVHASVEYVDAVGVRRDQAGRGTGLGEEMLAAISTADALVAVIRAFEDETGVSREPEADYEAIALELILSDLAKVESRLHRVTAHAARVGGVERQHLDEERRLMERLKKTLEGGSPLRSLEFTHDEERLLRSFQFLTVKPLLVAFNAGEGAAMADAAALVERLRAGQSGPEAPARAPVVGTGNARRCPAPLFLVIDGKTEMEIARLAPEERAEFLSTYGIDEPGCAKMIRLTYEALGLISFFTVNANEAHAWAVRAGSRAVQAAGAVHSDMERGFIRAQVIRWDDLLAAGSFAEARKHGRLRVEGKDYVVQDGDVMEILFHP